MNDTKSRVGILDFPIHSILLAVYPILYVLGRNLAHIPFSAAVRSLVLSIGVFSFLLLSFRVVLQDWDKAGVLSSLLSGLFYSFGHVANAMEEGLRHSSLGFDVSLLGWTWLLVFLLLSFVVVRFSIPEKTTRTLNLIGGTLLILSLSTIIRASNVDTELSPSEKADLAQLRGEVEAEASSGATPSSELPDIYYIIVDGYVRSDYLKELYGYDNSSFVNALEQRGFYVASSSHSNYLNTDYSLNTSLNLMYYHQFPESIFKKAKHNLLTNYVGDFLHEHGYRRVVFDSGTGDTNNQNAEVFVTPTTTDSERTGALNDFERFFLRTTLGLLFYGDHSPDAGSDVQDSVVKSAVNHELSLRRRRISHALTHLPDYASQDGHYLLFAHIYSPHIPFLYGPDGEELSYHGNLSLYWYEVRPENYIEYYTYQIDYLNHAVLDTVDVILKRSKKPVVIILQSDHGDEKFLDRDAPTTQGVNVRSAILNAIYFSDQSCDQFYPTITPVNTFRLVFNHWFGTQYPLLPDKVFFHEDPLSTGINEKPEFVDACVQFGVCLPAPP